MNRSHFVASGYTSTAQVAAALGVSVTTVKRWVDGGILPAHRTAGGHRKLMTADVVRLALSSDLPRADLGRLDPNLVAPSATEPARLVHQLAAVLRSGNAPAVRALLHNARRAGLSFEALADLVIAPAMAQVGHDWQAGRIDVWQEHRGTQAVATALYEMNAADDRPGRRPIACVAAPEGDHYLLPSLLAQMALRDTGWETVNLGPNTPFASLRLALEELRPRLVCVSVSFVADEERFVGDYGELFRAAETLGIPVALGGRALNEGLRCRLPYTVYGDGMRHLVAFARTLHPVPRPPRRGRPRQPVPSSSPADFQRRSKASRRSGAA